MSAPFISHAMLPSMGDPIASIRDSRSVSEVAQEFEALLLAYLLKTMRRSVESGGLFPKEAGHETYLEMMDQQLARSLARKQSLGIAELIEGQLKRENGSPKEVPAATESPYRPVSDMGWRRDPINGELRYHKGVDLAAPEGTPVPSLGGGKVVFSGWRRGYGNTVIVEDNQGTRVRYGHLKEALVRSGESVTANQILGRVGKTGRATGPHLHIEMEKGGRLVHPLTSHPKTQNNL